MFPTTSSTIKMSSHHNLTVGRREVSNGRVAHGVGHLTFGRRAAAGEHGSERARAATRRKKKVARNSHRPARSHPKATPRNGAAVPRSSDGNDPGRRQRRHPGHRGRETAQERPKRVMTNTSPPTRPRARDCWSPPRRRPHLASTHVTTPAAATRTASTRRRRVSRLLRC